MFVIVIVAPGDEDVHDMTAKLTYQQYDTRPTTDDDDGADTAHIMYAPPSSRQHNRTTSGIPTATLRVGIDLAGRNNHENDRPRLQLTIARTHGFVLVLSAPGDETLTSMITALSQASPALHHVMVDMINGCASSTPAAEIVIAPCCRNDLTKALCDYRCFGQRRGTALSNAPPIGSGQHLDLEVKLLKPFYQPRALAIIRSHGKGLVQRTRTQHYKEPYGTHLGAVRQVDLVRSPFPALPSFAAAPPASRRPRRTVPLRSCFCGYSSASFFPILA